MRTVDVKNTICVLDRHELFVDGIEAALRWEEVDSADPLVGSPARILTG